MPAWDDDSKPKFVDFETVKFQTDDHSLHMNAHSWKNLAEHASLWGDTLFLENGPRITDPEQRVEDHGDILEGMCSAGC
jgi:hypothetical protein